MFGTESLGCLFELNINRPYIFDEHCRQYVVAARQREREGTQEAQDAQERGAFLVSLVLFVFLPFPGNKSFTSKLSTLSGQKARRIL